MLKNLMKANQNRKDYYPTTRDFKGKSMTKEYVNLSSRQSHSMAMSIYQKYYPAKRLRDQKFKYNIKKIQKQTLKVQGNPSSSKTKF